MYSVFVVSAQVGTSILPYLKLWPVDTYVDLMMEVIINVVPYYSRSQCDPGQQRRAGIKLAKFLPY